MLLSTSFYNPYNPLCVIETESQLETDTKLLKIKFKIGGKKAYIQSLAN